VDLLIGIGPYHPFADLYGSGLHVYLVTNIFTSLLHHLGAFIPVERAVVSAADFVSADMCKFCFDCISRSKVTFIQETESAGTEAMRGCFFSREAHAPQCTVNVFSLMVRCRE